MAAIGTLALVPAPTAPSAHLDRYNALSPVARVVAQVYGVAASRALSISRIHRALRIVQLRVDGRAVTLDQARRANNELTKAGLLVDGAARSTVEYVRDGRTTTDGWALSLTSIAHADGTLDLTGALSQRHVTPPSGRLGHTIVIGLWGHRYAFLG